MTMHRYDSFEESPPPPPHPHSHILESNMNFGIPQNSRDLSSDFSSSTLPLTVNGGPVLKYVNEGITTLPFSSAGSTEFDGYGGSGGVIIGSGGVITSGSGLSAFGGSVAGTLSRNGNSGGTNIKRSSMLDLTAITTPNTTPNNDHESTGPTDTMLSHSTTNKAPFPEDDEDDVTNPSLNPQQQNYPMQGFQHTPQQRLVSSSSQSHRAINNGSSQLAGGYHSNSKLHKLAQKHGLNKKGLVLLILSSAICILLLVALITMVVLWPKSDDGDDMDVCLTPDCLRASAQVRYSFVVL